MKKQVFKSKLATTAIFLLSTFLATIFILRKTLSNDADIYYTAGKVIQNGLSPWSSALNPFEQFLYGPIHAVFITILANFSEYNFVVLIKAITCLSLLVISIQSLESKKEALLIFGLAMLTVSFRSNIQYGAIGGLESVIAIWFFYVLTKRNDKLLIAAQVLLLDFKPHIYLFTILTNVTRKRLLALLTTQFSVYLFIYVAAKNLSIQLWLETILNRKQGLSQDPTLISPVMLTLGNYIPTLLLFMLSMFSVLLISIYAVKKGFDKQLSFVLLYGTALITTPYLHTIDTLGLIFILLLLLQKSNKRHPLTLLVILFNTLWSNSLQINLIVAAMASVIVFFLKWEISRVAYISTLLIYLILNGFWFFWLEKNYIPNFFYATLLLTNFAMVIRLSKRADVKT